MDIYTPVFSKIVDSSLWSEPDFVVKIFITMLAKKDADMVVRGNAYNIANWSKKTEQEVLQALEILSSPDTRRLEPQPHEGRRIQRVEDGWLILNGQHYQNLMRKVHRNAYQAEKQREYRSKKSKKEDNGSGPLPGEQAAVKAYERGDDAEFDRLAAKGTEKRSKALKTLIEKAACK